MNNAKYLRYALFAMMLLGTVKQTLSMDEYLEDFETPSEERDSFLGNDEALDHTLLFAEYKREGQFSQELPLDFEGFEIKEEQEQEQEPPRGLVRQNRRDL